MITLMLQAIILYMCPVLSTGTRTKQNKVGHFHFRLVADSTGGRYVVAEGGKS